MGVEELLQSCWWNRKTIETRIGYKIEHFKKNKILIEAGPGKVTSSIRSVNCGGGYPRIEILWHYVGVFQRSSEIPIANIGQSWTHIADNRYVSGR